MNELFCAPGFALELRLACAYQNISQRTAAQRAQVSSATFNRIATKESVPDIETYFKLKHWLAAALPEHNRAQSIADSQEPG